MDDQDNTGASVAGNSQGGVGAQQGGQQDPQRLDPRSGGVGSEYPIPSIGRIVHYHLTAEQAEAINRRREHSDNHRSMHAAAANGTIIHVGNKAAEGDTVPMLIVKTWGHNADSAVNGQAFLDGNDTLWVTSTHVGEGDPGTYSWPSRQ